MNKRKLILSGVAANMFEWYDYTLYLHLTKFLADKFFLHNVSPLLHTFFIFAAGYLTRPLGGLFFGIIGDKFGRRFSLSAAVMCMAFPTVVMGLLPVYEIGGNFSSVMMIISRMLQGLSVGGALTGSISFLIEHSPKHQRGFIGSTSMIGLCCGILLGSLVIFLVKSSMSVESFYAWGWRIPFILGIFIIFAGVYIKKHTAESPMFEEIKNSGDVLQNPIKVVLTHYWKDIIVSIFINATGSVIFYFQAGYVMNYLRDVRQIDEYSLQILDMVSNVIMALTCLVIGKLSDKIDRKKIYFYILFSIAVTLFFILFQLVNGSFWQIVIANIVLSILAAAYIAPEPALQSEFYPTNVRSTALSIAYNLGTSIFGGPSLWIFHKMLSTTGSLYSCGYYIIFVVFTSFFALRFYKDRS